MIVGGTYTVIVQAPDVLPGPPRPWLVTASSDESKGPLARAVHYDLETACGEVFAAVRKDIDARMDRGIEVGRNDAPHDGAGADEHRAATGDEGMSPAQVFAWCDHVDDLVAGQPEVNAHQLRNMAGEFAFSPGTCPLCAALAEIEVQARTEILASGEPATSGVQ